ncbi:hypothetical protein AAC387_Pa10g1994 [Persea americana]
MLDISNNPNLTIHLPEFPQNSALQYLYMQATRIDGKLPDSIGYLKFLKVLSLRNCNLFGSLPSSIANLSHLESLDLSANNISGMIPFSRANELQRLNRLNLDNNALEGSISPSLFSHPSLQVLSLSNNQLNDSLLDFHNVTSSVLELVYLDHNNLRGEIPSHMQLDKKVAERTLRELMGDAVAAVRYLLQFATCFVKELMKCISISLVSISLIPILKLFKLPNYVVAPSDLNMDFHKICP